MIAYCSRCDRTVVTKESGDCPSCGRSDGFSPEGAAEPAVPSQNWADGIIECRFSSVDGNIQLIFSATMVLFSCWGIYHGTLVRPQLSFAIVNGLMIILFAAFFVSLLKRKVLKTVMIRLDDEGLHRSSGVVYRWEDFKAIRQTTFKFTTLLEFTLRNGTRYRSRSALGRFFQSSEKEPTIMIPISSLDVTVDDIFRVVERRTRPYRKE